MSILTRLKIFTFNWILIRLLRKQNSVYLWDIGIYQFLKLIWQNFWGQFASTEIWQQQCAPIKLEFSLQKPNLIERITCFALKFHVTLRVKCLPRHSRDNYLILCYITFLERSLVQPCTEVQKVISRWGFWEFSWTKI